MAGEINRAYPVLKREWIARGGRLLRLRPPGVSGIPDFCLFHPDCGSVFCEIKAVENSSDRLKFEPLQLDTLEQIRQYGGQSCVLVYNTAERRWGGISRPDRGLLKNYIWSECKFKINSLTVSFVLSLVEGKFF